MPRHRARGKAATQYGGRGGGNSRGRNSGGGGRGGGLYMQPGPGKFPNPYHHGELNGAREGAFELFSMRDEARNTERHHTGWSQYRGSSLRDIAIKFVSAGTLDPIELLKPTVVSPGDKDSSKEVDTEQGGPMEDIDPNSPNDDLSNESASSIDVGRLDLGVGEVETKEPHHEQEMPGFMLDLEGDNDLDPKIEVPVVRRPSPSPSISSSASEKIVFVPKTLRGVSQSRTSTLTAPKPQKGPAPQERVTAITQVGLNFEASAQVETTDITSILPQLEPVAPNHEADYIELNSQPQWTGKRATPGNKRRKGRGRGRQGVDDEAVKDYMENIAAQMRAEAIEGKTPMDSGRGLLRDIGGIDDWGYDSSTDEDDAASDSDAIRQYRNGDWDEDQLRDFDGISTDEEGPRGLIATLLGKRIRPSGVQYLVKWDGHETDDATWTLANTLDSSAEAKIKKYEEELAAKKARMEESSDSGSSNDFDDDDDDEADEDEDHKFAKFLQKQEELGLMGVEEYDEIMDLEDDFFPIGVAKRGSKQKRKSRQTMTDIIIDPSTGQFPSASKMAAAYDGFDVMDWERPSIAMPVSGRKKKGKGKHLELNLSDSELEAQITNSWKRDRESKKLKRIQREELRAQGVLGIKAQETEKVNLLDKYKEGITMTQVFDEIRSFMLKEHSSLRLPPMAREDRKIIHELAGKLNLKSKSIGGGKSRFTTIIKTSRSSTYQFDEEAVDSILRQNKFMKRMDVGGRRRMKKANASSGGGEKGSRRDGMVVGASAPELSATNKGRLMLEKMGYKPGMSLGAEGNQGISEPVMAIIKMSKAGLG